jgi:hypothetical protein
MRAVPDGLFAKIVPRITVSGAASVKPVRNLPGRNLFFAGGIARLSSD